MANNISKIIEGLLGEYRNGNIEDQQFIDKIKGLYFEDIGFAKVDHHRALRRDFPEVIFGTNKTPEQTLEIAKSILKYSDILFITRTDQKTFDLLKKNLDGIDLRFNNSLIYTQPEVPEEKLKEGITVICAGTSDIHIAEEAAITCFLMKNKVKKIYDVGIAGIHRLIHYKEDLVNSNVIVAIAGMEGALPGVVSAMVDCPVIGVPTSIGYGASFNGISPLLTMLNSCSPGVVVVNIDNGFGAGYTAGMINRSINKI